ncbi:MAG TPA: tRNA (N6-threonylcarbamoyladenosine(37)-N6)-methyltransferase TrmO [Ruminococcaceae bacterium]|nr:tRNA (N6-threonylcarbamoyladenosine(37)-N6)-methyltransferase TrmO [Oscillospiraceae bacterium]
MKTIAKIHTDFPTKFGIPRQSGLVEELKGRIVFEPEFRNSDAIRGLDGFSHIWLLWKFNTPAENHSLTVRPPKLGGNVRMGVFATRSPFRPNNIGLSCVKLEGIDGTDLLVSGADLMDGTEIVDIKPYVPYADCHPDAVGGFSKDGTERLHVDASDEVLSLFPENKRAALIKVLELDPRPQYQNDPDRLYGFGFAGFDVRFTVDNNTLFVKEIKKLTGC